MKVLTRYAMPAVLTLEGVAQARDGDWWMVAQLASTAVVFLAVSIYVPAVGHARVAEHRAGYTRGVLAALEVELHQRRTGERRPIPTPDAVHPDDPIEVHR